MVQGLLVSPAFVQTVRDINRRLSGEPLNRTLKRARYPIKAGGKGQKFYRLTGATYIHRGSHPDGVEADEVKASSVSVGRIVWETVRTGVTLYCGSNGVYVQRDGGTIGNNPGDPTGGDPADPLPCPPNCVFTGNAIGSAEVTTLPDWWSVGGAATELQTNTATQSTVYAVTGQRAGGYDFTTGSWETQWVGVLDEDLAGGSFASVTIDGIGSVDAFALCTDGISEGSTVHVMWRELAGAGGFVILGRVCCPGYDA